MQKETFSLLVFHGSARSEANMAATEFAKKLQDLNCQNFSVCFLKGVSPDLNQALTEAAVAGIIRIRITPLFLLPGSHISRDIPEIVDEAKKKFPQLEISIDKCLVESPEFIDLSAARLKNNG